MPNDKNEFYDFFSFGQHVELKERKNLICFSQLSSFMFEMIDPCYDKWIENPLRCRRNIDNHFTHLYMFSNEYFSDAVKSLALLNDIEL